MNFHENRSKGSGGMGLTRNLRVNLLTLTLSLGSWVTCSAHHLTKRNIQVNFHENRSKGSGDMERTQKSKVNPLTWNLGRWTMCSAHRLTKWNI